MAYLDSRQSTSIPWHLATLTLASNFSSAHYYLIGYTFEESAICACAREYTSQNTVVSNRVRMEGHPGSKGDVGPPKASEPGLPDEASSVPATTLEEERREKVLIWKIDLHILPFVVLLYLFSFLDRG